MNRPTLPIIALAMILTTPAFAMDHAAHGQPANLYAKDMAAMHENMQADVSGDPDIDFVRQMIPHHEGAVAMAKTQLEHGKDPEIRALSEAIVKSQEQEISMMKAWLAAHDTK